MGEFNKSNVFAHGKPKLWDWVCLWHLFHMRTEVKKDYKRYIDIVWLLASQPQPPLCFLLMTLIPSVMVKFPTFKPVGIRFPRNCMQARLPGSIMLWKEIIKARYCSSWSKACGPACCELTFLALGVLKPKVGILCLSSVNLSIKFYKLQKTAFWQKATQQMCHVVLSIVHGFVILVCTFRGTRTPRNLI